MLAAMAPLLAGCNEPTAVAAVAAAPAEPEVGTFTVRPQSRALVRELPGCDPQREADGTDKPGARRARAGHRHTRQVEVAR